MIKIAIGIVLIVGVVLLAAKANEAFAYGTTHCSTVGRDIVCYTYDDNRLQGSNNPRQTIIPVPVAPTPTYVPPTRQRAPEPDWDACTLALGCIRGRG